MGGQRLFILGFCTLIGKKPRAPRTNCSELQRWSWFQNQEKCPPSVLRSRWFLNQEHHSKIRKYAPLCASRSWWFWNQEDRCGLLWFALGALGLWPMRNHAHQEHRSKLQQSSWFLTNEKPSTPRALQQTAAKLLVFDQWETMHTKSTAANCSDALGFKTTTTVMHRGGGAVKSLFLFALGSSTSQLLKDFGVLFQILTTE